MLMQSGRRIVLAQGGTLSSGMIEQERQAWRCYGDPMDFRRNRLHGRTVASAVAGAIEWAHEAGCQKETDWVY